VFFRDLSQEDSICSDSRLLGDRVVINPQTINETVPFTLQEAQSGGYVLGACMDTMGQHWFKDVTT